MKRIAIHSAPRSGSSWLGQIFNSSPDVAYKFQPLFSYAFKGRLKSTSTRQEIKEFFAEIAYSEDDFLNQREAKGCKFSKAEIIQFCVYKEVRYHNILENLLTQDPELKVIGIVRNPLAVLASWKRAPKEFKADWDFGAEWRKAPSKNLGREEEFNGYFKWKEVANLFLDLEANHPDQFRLVEYKNLLANPETVVNELFHYCGISMNSQTSDFINRSTSQQNSDAYSVFKCKTDDESWSREIPQDVRNEILVDLRSSRLERFV